MNRMTRWNPTQEIQNFNAMFNRMFEPFFGRDLTAGGSELAAGAWMPAVDVEETGDRLILRAELPGVKREAIDIEFENGVLTIRGERKFENERSDRHFHRVERAYGSFARSFSMPRTVDVDRVEATYEDGILTLELPKREEAKPRRITIGGGSARQIEAKTSDAA